MYANKIKKCIMKIQTFLKYYFLPGVFLLRCSSFCAQVKIYFPKGLCDVYFWKQLVEIMELGHDVTEEESGVANDDLDKATPKVSDQTEHSEEAFEDLSDDDGFREVVVVCNGVCNVVRQLCQCQHSGNDLCRPIRGSIQVT